MMKDWEHEKVDFLVEKIPKGALMFELGCGNGRDAFFFGKSGINIHASDISDASIVQLNGKATNGNPLFVCADFTNLPTPYEHQYDAVYSRFTLHAIQAEGASRTLKWAHANLKSGGYLYIEVRSVLDPMCGKGTKVEGERDAWINTHYRRFIRKDELVSELEGLGFTLEYVLEKDGIAVYKDDNPVVIRVHAKKL